ncbi:hypothetical protein [Paucisalibacillus globulus]|jgi:hypothetical protein|nr:hypothetical protein [Paucisalibacillus globulus]
MYRTKVLIFKNGKDDEEMFSKVNKTDLFYIVAFALTLGFLYLSLISA